MDRPDSTVSLKEAYLFGKKWLASSITAHIPQGKGPGAAIRRKCLECTNGQLADITHCPITNCPLWPYRSGKNPFHKRSKLDVTPE